MGRSVMIQLFSKNLLINLSATVNRDEEFSNPPLGPRFDQITQVEPKEGSDAQDDSPKSVAAESRPHLSSEQLKHQSVLIFMDRSRSSDATKFNDFC